MGKRAVAILTLLVLAIPLAGASSESERAFVELKKEVGSFRADAERRKFRHNYLNLVKRLEAASRTHASGDRGDDFLFVAAQLHEELYAASRVGEDLDAAVDSYADLARRFPKANLADDALFQAAKITLERQGDRERARGFLDAVIAMGRGADMLPRARELLARLPPPAPSEAPTAVVSDDVEEILEKLAATEGEQPKASMPPVEVLPDAPKAGTPARKFSGVKHETEGDTSVVRILLSGEVGIVRGEAPATSTRARRVFFDLTPAHLGAQSIKPVVIEDGTVARVRAGQYTRDTVRVVIELQGELEPSLSVNGRASAFELRLTSALKNARAPTVAVKAPVVAKSEKVAAAPTADEVRKRLGGTGAPGGVSISQQIGLKVKRIVIDPGHGGRDTGAIGPSGTKEKHVTLAIAKQVRSQLKKILPHVEVHMTRDDDATLELKDRTDLANETHADLFISIHANANPSRKVRGVETYYLNITHDRYAMRLAQRENEVHDDDKSISDLQFILADLAMKSNVDDSVRLGRQVQRALVGELREDFSNVQDLGLKHALFYVLMGARMPAILVETSFLSNRVEEKRLSDTKYQQKVAEGIVLGITRFLSERQAFYAGK